MSDVAIRVDGVGKQYRLGGARERYSTLGDQIRKWTSLRTILARRSRTRDENHPPFWALKDVSFEVKRGEVLGIIGRNGAGKSTLLKILSRITEPTEGAIDIHGRVGSLLEVGTGFHPELTGRENVYLNGAILGMRRHEIDRKFDQIVDFAEISSFLETPVKRYSSGMYVRLAFAVAAHLEPEILIVDEVLAVGDMAFQRKCMGRMREVGKSGSTILFVSHNMPAVESLCTRAILLDKGKVLLDGEVRPLVQEYHRRILSSHGEVGSDLAIHESPGRVHKIFRSVTLLDDDGQPTNFVPMGGKLHVRVGLNTPIEIESPVVTIGIDDNMGQRLISLQTPASTPVLPRLQRPGTLDCVVPQLPLAPGDYWIKLGLAAVPDEIDEIERVLRFTVTDGDAFGQGRGFHRGLCVAPSQWAFAADE